MFGEHTSKTCNNNAFFIWNNIVGVRDDIDAYFVLEKNKKNIEATLSIPLKKRKNILWKNSLKHKYMFEKTDMFFVATSYRDVLPSGRKLSAINNPIIYVQHGILGLKKIGYQGDSYSNKLTRFFIYNPNIIETFRKENNFEDYQIYHTSFQPRYQALSQQHLDFSKEKSKEKIFWFLTWREYLGNNYETEDFLNTIQEVVRNENLKKFLEEKDLTLNICFHDYFKSNYLKKINDLISVNSDGFINVHRAKDTDIMKEIVESDLLITDYSSIAIDFAFLNKPTILFAPDYDTYSKEREFYTDYDKELSWMVAKDFNELLLKLNKYDEIENYFRNIFPQQINYEEIAKGNFIQDIFDYFYKLQTNKISFIGYNFYGRGGTVTSTHALAEALMNEDYLVELISLKQIRLSEKASNALIMKSLYREGKRKFLKRHFIKLKSLDYNRSYLNYDISKDYIHPFIGWRLPKFLRRLKTKVAISTRESIHFFLDDIKNKYIDKKIYYFHRDFEHLKEYTPEVYNMLGERYFENKVFVSEASKLEYIELFGEELKSAKVIGNTLRGNGILTLSELENLCDEKEETNKNKVFKGVYLTRIALDRKEHLQSLIDFALFLKESNIKNIQIDLYGSGGYAEEFSEKLKGIPLEGFLSYKGNTNFPKERIRNSDFVVSFSDNDSFGMAYIEAILNGKPVFTKINARSNFCT